MCQCCSAHSAAKKDEKKEGKGGCKKPVKK